MKSTNGHLYIWLGHLMTLKPLIDSNILSVNCSLMDLQDSIKKLIRERREAGDNWLWCPEDIELDEGEYILPSVSLSSYFGLENNHELKSFFKRNGCKARVIWDTESSAWYPRFVTQYDAKDVIVFINQMFDKTFLLKK